MKSGSLRHLVSLQSSSELEDDYGQDIETWTEYGQVYAAIVPLRGGEFFNAQQVNSKITVKIIIRYRSDVKHLHRVVHEGVTYKVSAPPIDPQLKHKELHLMCEIIVVAQPVVVDNPLVLLDSSINKISGTVTRGTEGTIYNSAKDIEYVAANTPRLDYLNGVKQGYYFGGVNTNQFTKSEPTVADLTTAVNVTDATIDWLSELTAGIEFPDTATAANALVTYSALTAVDNAQGIFVKMLDGGVPVVGAGTSGNDFYLTMDGTVVTSAVVDLINSDENVYRIKATHLHDGAGTTYGVTRESGHSGRGFTISGFSLNAGTDQVLHYVPTTAGSEFQAADAHALAFPVEIDQTGWGANLECALTHTEDGAFVTLYSASDGTTNNKVEIFRQADNTLVLNVKTGGVAYNLATASTFLNGDTIKVAFSITAGASKMSVNGAATILQAVAAPNVLDRHTVGGASWASGREADAHLQYCELIDTSRSSAELEAASTP